MDTSQPAGGIVFWILLPYIFMSLYGLLYVAMAVVLVTKWLRTHDAGIAWLGVAVVIWPWIVRLMDRGENVQIRRLMRHQPVGFFPFNLVEHGQATILDIVRTLQWSQDIVGVCFLLTAVIHLYKSKVECKRRDAQVVPSNSGA